MIPEKKDITMNRPSMYWPWTLSYWHHHLPLLIITYLYNFRFIKRVGISNHTAAKNSKTKEPKSIFSPEIVQSFCVVCTYKLRELKAKVGSALLILKCLTNDPSWGLSTVLSCCNFTKRQANQVQYHMNTCLSRTVYNILGQ